MANRYIIHGATHCGDGTASNEAASAGAEGAWNNIDILTGTPPTNTTNIPAAGDVIYIRSKSSAGADITITLAGQTWMGSFAATAANWITWVIDAGTVWSGIDGVVKFSSDDNGKILHTVENNTYFAEKSGGLVFENTMAAPVNAEIIRLVSSQIINPVFIAPGFGDGVKLGIGGGIVKCRIVNPKVTIGRIGIAFFHINQIGAMMEVVNPVVTVQAAGGLLSANIDRGRLSILGGSLSGPGAVSGTFLTNGGGNSTTTIVGFKYPKSVGFCNSRFSNQFMGVHALGIDDGAGAAVSETWGDADSRNDGNYPYLNATFPNSTSTPWSWKIYPVAASQKFVASMPILTYYTTVAAVNTLTVECLIADTFSNISKKTVWLEGCYIDNLTGETKIFTTQLPSPVALDTSTAAWQPSTTWGPVSLVKRKISYTTPTAIKQNTIVTLNFCIATASSTLEDIIFLCPAAQLS